MRNAVICLLIVAQVLTTGCYHRVEIPKEELTNHATFSSPEGKQTFLVTKKDGYVSRDFSSLRIENRQVIGQLKDVKGVENAIPVSDIERVEKREFSAGLTTLGVLGGLAGVGAFIFGVLLLAWANMKNFGGS
jgi:hypothetical protein